MNDSKFSTGFLIGLIIGGGAVFLLGTKTGKNILRVISEEGIDGLVSLLEEYDLAEVEEEDIVDEKYESSHASNGHAKKEVVSEVYEKAPKRRFFKRVRR